MAQLFATIGLILKFWNEVSTIVEMLQQKAMEDKTGENEILRSQIKGAKTDDERRALVSRLVGFGP